MLRKFQLFAVAVIFIGIAWAQQNPAKWTFKTIKVNDSIANLIMKCDLNPGWHIYSQKTKGTEIPIIFTFENTKNYKRLGGVKEPKYLAKYDKYQKDTTRYFEGTVIFNQQIKIKTNKDFKVEGVVTFQLCENG